MSLIHCEGFDTYGLPSNPNDQDSDSSAVLMASGGLNSNGGGYVRLSSFTRTGIGQSIKIGYTGGAYKAFNPTGDLIFGIAFFSNSLLPRTIIRGAFDNYLGSVGTQFNVLTNQTGAITVQFNAGPGYVYSPVNAMFTSTWHYIEGRIKLSTGSDGVIEIRVDGDTVISYTGPTITSGPSLCNIVAWDGLNPNLPGYFLDDLYLVNKDGTGLTDFLGDCVVHALLPVSDAAPNAMTKTGGSVSHASAVSEVPPNEDTSYLESSTAGDQEFFDLSTVPSDTIDILAVQTNIRIRKSAAGIAHYQAGVRSGGTVAWSPAVAPPLAYMNQFSIFENDPNGGGSWTKDSLQAAQIGIKVS